MTFRVLLVGLGAIGMGYDSDSASDSQVRSHARAFIRNSAFGPLAAVEPDAGRRQLFVAKYHSSSYPSLDIALETERPDLVVIATPTISHRDTLNQILAACTPVAILCEKPLAYELEDAEEMVAACSRRGVEMYVNYMRRSDPGVIAVRDMIRRGEIETPIKGVVWYSKGLIHNGSHFVNLIRYWLGEPRQTSKIRPGRFWGDKDPEPDFLIEYGDAQIAYFAAKEESFSHYTVELVAQNGRLRYEEGGATIVWQCLIDDPDSPGYRVLNRKRSMLPADLARAQWHVVNHLENALNGRASELCTGAEALETLRDIHRVIKLT